MTYEEELKDLQEELTDTEKSVTEAKKEIEEARIWHGQMLIRYANAIIALDRFKKSNGI